MVEKDSFQLLQVGKVVKSTMKNSDANTTRNNHLNTGLRGSYRLAKASLEIQFGFNRKQDNQFKTKQLKLF